MAVKTLVVDNFRGSLTQFNKGNINSGLAYAVNTGGNDPFSKPGNLTWSRIGEQIDSAGDVITDLIMAGKERVESNILYVYAIGHTGRLYKIQVNDPTTFDPNYDNPVLLATLTAQTPTFTRGGSIDFFGSTERIYIGHDKGVTRIDFNGANETFVGSAGSYTATVPRPLQQFVGKLYFGNGTNIGEIDSTATVSTYGKLSPAFPIGTQVRDIDVNPDGTYVQIVSSRVPSGDVTSATEILTRTASSDSFIFKWNGTDTGYTSVDTFSSFSMTSNTVFGPYQYTFGYDMSGASLFNPVEKLLALQEIPAPSPNAVAAQGSIVSWITPLPYAGFLEADLGMYGTFDYDIGTGYWYPFFQYPTGDETDIVRVPCQIMVSNFGIGASNNGYTDNIFGLPKIYFSTLETSDAPTTKYKFYKWSPPSGPYYVSGEPLFEAIYQTQTQLFSKKIKPTEIRIYAEPWVANNSFSLDLLGSDGNAISGGSKTFSIGDGLTIGNDYAWWNPQCEPTYALALFFTNLGTTNHTIFKVEIDYEEMGK